MHIMLDQQPTAALGRAPAGAAQGAQVLIALFVLSLLIPSDWEIAGLRLDTARVYALAMVIPLAVRWLAREAGRPLPVDILILLHGFWIVVTMVVNHGAGRIAFAGMNVVEILCGYFVGRILIRDTGGFRYLFQVLLVVLVVLIPFAIAEMIKGQAVLQPIFRSLLGSAHGNVVADHPPRLGFYRAQTVMQHPILWGVFCAIVVANVFYIWRHRLPGAVARAGVAGLGCFSSMSSGAVVSMLLQGLLIVWGWATKGAWKLLMIAFVSVYAFLTVASNRGPVVLMIETLTFSAGTGWARIHIWNHGIDDAVRNPIFGIGLHEHTRPDWLTPSVDNFWLLMMMRHGFVGFGLLAAALAWHIWKVTTAEGLSAYERRLREGYMIALVGLIFSLATVHFWGPPYLLMFAYIGSGVWFYAGRERLPEASTPTAGEIGEDEPAGTREGSGLDLPFARSFAGAAARERDVTLSRIVAQPHTAPLRETRHDRQEFSRRGNLSDRRNP